MPCGAGARSTTCLPARRSMRSSSRHPRAGGAGGQRHSPRWNGARRAARGSDRRGEGVHAAARGAERVGEAARVARGAPRESRLRLARPGARGRVGARQVDGVALASRASARTDRGIVRRRLIAASVLVAACASAGPPPGGPDDRLPPKLVHVAPDTNSVNYRGKDATFTFDEQINNRGAGESDIDAFFLVSPTDGPPRVRWHRTRIEVRPPP